MEKAYPVIYFCQQILFYFTDVFLDSMVASKQLEEPLKEEVRDVLLLRHRHLYDKKHKHDENGGSKYHLPIIRSFADIGRKYSEPRGLNHHGKDSDSPSPPGEGIKLFQIFFLRCSLDVGFQYRACCIKYTVYIFGSPRLL